MRSTKLFPLSVRFRLLFSTSNRIAMTAIGQKRDATQLSGASNAASASDKDAGSKKLKSAPTSNGKASIRSFFAKDVNKTSAMAATASASASSKFDKQKWVSSLTDEQRDLLKLEIDTLHDSWLAELRDELLTKNFLDLKRFLKREWESGATIFPPQNNIYSWSRYTPLSSVKVVIIGQDPYHDYNQAHGLCFSVLPPTPAPPSLKNIFTAIQNDYPSFQRPPNKGGLLTPWAERGVLMINTCLTVRAHNANSHAKRGWEAFTQKVIDTVAAKRNRGVVFMAWGNSAAERISKVDKSKHHILRSAHPSPLSVRYGFLTCGHFKKANEWLQSRYGDDAIIDWSLDSGPSKTVTQTAVAASSVSVAEKAKEKVTETTKDTKNTKKESTISKDDENEMKALESLVDAEFD